MRVQVTRWADLLGHAVQAVTDADAGIRPALAAVVVDSAIMDGAMSGCDRTSAKRSCASREENR
ncbi:hypothetical protein [Streptomyces sp. NPDC026589]|uniref:hypothetical protein n=1 Tax=Streptomyces sp. NPDC026589 TaxID=3155609 RepID=UPI0033C12656